MQTSLGVNKDLKFWLFQIIYFPVRFTEKNNVNFCE